MALEIVRRRISYHPAGWDPYDPNDSHRLEAIEEPPQAQVSCQPADDTGGDTQTSSDRTGMDARVYKAVAKGDIAYLNDLSENRLQAQLTPNHNTILHVAAHFGQTECANWILALPPCASFPLRPNLKGETPLHLAAREGHLEVVEALIDAAKVLPEDVEIRRGARYKEMIRMMNKEGDTALHEAVRYGHEDVVSKLLKADPEFVYGANASGGTPLYMAAERGFGGLVKTLVQESPSPAYTGFMGRTALHAAVICNDKEMMEKLLEWRPALSKQVDRAGWSPLHCAAQTGCDTSIVKLLLEKSDKSLAYFQTKQRKLTALHIASYNHYTEIVEAILSHAPDCWELVDSDGNNVFHISLKKKNDLEFRPSHYFSNEWLRGRGSVNERDAQGNTPLHLLSDYPISDPRFKHSSLVDGKALNATELKASTASIDFPIVETLEMLSIVRESESLTDNYVTDLKKKAKTHLLVAVLIATVTFTAGFTLPGGTDDQDGTAILKKKTAFQAFVVMDTVAMVCSVSAVLLHFFMTLHKDEGEVRSHLIWAFRLTMFGMVAMVFAFALALYSALPPDSWRLSAFSCGASCCFLISFSFQYRAVRNMYGKKYWIQGSGDTGESVKFLDDLYYEDCEGTSQRRRHPHPA